MINPSNSNRVLITECPRDAMQGIRDFIPTAVKVSYLNSLLKAGFDRLDFGSFVSPKAVPQLQDTRQVLESLDASTGTALIAIVANIKGAQMAAEHSRISFIGYPFSVSETFQQRNTNAGISESYESVKRMTDIASSAGQKLMIYISMGFGNPYNDPWNDEIVTNWIEKLGLLGITHFAMADTVGIASPETIEQMLRKVISRFPRYEIGAHLHCSQANWEAKTNAAFMAGCRNFDCAIKGFGGCPMADDELVGNLATENLVQYLREKDVSIQIREREFAEAMKMAGLVFMTSESGLKIQ